MHPVVMLQLLVLLSVANGAPLIAKKLFGDMLTQPIDGGRRFVDRRPLLGASKTLRGVVASVATTTIVAPLIGLSWSIGALVGVTAMAGDLFSSFCKRRLNRPPSSQATGLDQIPEALFPLLACLPVFGLTLADIVVGVVVFFVGEVVLSRVFYRLGLRDDPY
jgi:CDP-2,3-bis-(O-geranylgeranyl)-sn-glycerol synthase